MESLHFAKRGFHAGASAVEVGAFFRGIRMLAQPLARWLAAWAGLIGWLAGWSGWAGWLTCTHDVMTIALSLQCTIWMASEEFRKVEFRWTMAIAQTL